jgi:hypothetical protein
MYENANFVNSILIVCTHACCFYFKFKTFLRFVSFAFMFDSLTKNFSTDFNLFHDCKECLFMLHLHFLSYIFVLKLYFSLRFLFWQRELFFFFLIFFRAHEVFFFVKNQFLGVNNTQREHNLIWKIFCVCVLFCFLQKKNW